MTTIVYDNKSNKIALDSRQVAGGIIISDEKIKYRKLGDEYLFLAGCVSDFDFFVAHGKARKAPDFAIDVQCLRVVNGLVMMCGIDNNEGYWEEICDSSRAIGSGGNLAISALDFGESAKEAVEYAATRDIYTGGKVRVFNIGTMEFEL